MERTPVLIVGGGPTGLALAYGLAHHGVRSVVLEAQPEFCPESRALGILPRTLEIFRAWGLLERFAAAGTVLGKPTIWRADLRTPLVTFDLAAVLGRLHCAAPGALFLSQYRTEQVLATALAETGLSEVRFNHRLLSFHQDERGVVAEAAVESGATIAIEAEYMVGCDGARSAVRGQLGWELEGRTYPTTVLLADVRVDGARDQLPWPRLDPAAHLSFAARVEPGLWRLVLAQAARKDVESAASRQAVVDRLAVRLLGEGPVQTVWASTFQIHCRVSPHFRAGRVLLAGDAAHINSPAGGQGMNSGIHDGHNLAWKLARARRGGDAAALLVSYEQERRQAVVRNVSRYTDWLTRVLVLSPKRARNAVLSASRRAFRSRWLMAQLIRRMAMLDTLYQDSTCISGRGALLGRRAPDAPVAGSDGRQRRVHDLVCPGAAVVLFQRDLEEPWDLGLVKAHLAELQDVAVYRILPMGATAAGAEDLVDVSGAVWTAWEPGARTAVLIRPDAHVGWRADAPSLATLRVGCMTALGGLAGQLQDTGKPSPHIPAPEITYA